MCTFERFLTAIKGLRPLLLTLSLTLPLTLLAACDTLAAPTVTPLSTLSGPTIEPSPQVAQPNPFEMVPDEFIGVNDPTAAAMAPDSALPPMLNPASTPDGIRQPVEIVAEDGAMLTGDLYLMPGDRRPGVLLLAQDHLFWGDYPLKLVDAGFTVLVMDMRSTDVIGALPDFEVMLRSLSSGLAQPDRLAVIGSNMGADLALFGCGAELLCDAVVLLSPAGLLDAVTAMGNYGNRPILLTASDEDTAAFAAITALQAAALGEVLFQPLTGAGTGTDMLFTRPDLGDLIIQWLQQRV
jgi:hypothetical protein